MYQQYLLYKKFMFTVARWLKQQAFYTIEEYLSQDSSSFISILMFNSFNSFISFQILVLLCMLGLDELTV